MGLVVEVEPAMVDDATMVNFVRAGTVWWQ